jgi:hypothetical protein
MYLEKDELIENLQTGKLAKRQNDEWVGGPIPFGYETEKNKLVENKVESVILKEIFDRANWETVQEVYEYVCGEEYKQKDGKPISRSALYRMFEPQRIHIYLGKKYKTPLLDIKDLPESYYKKYMNWLNKEGK